MGNGDAMPGAQFSARMMPRQRELRETPPSVEEIP
jgi:hypothetical protein